MILKCLKIIRYLKYRYILKYWIGVLVFDRYWGIEGIVVIVWFVVDDLDVKNGCL